MSDETGNRMIAVAVAAKAAAVGMFVQMIGQEVAPSWFTMREGVPIFTQGVVLGVVTTLLLALIAVHIWVMDE